MIGNLQRELERWGNWMKRRRSKPQLEELDPQLLVCYIQQRTPFRSKATVYSVMSGWGMGDIPQHRSPKVADLDPFKDDLEAGWEHMLRHQLPPWRAQTASTRPQRSPVSRGSLNSVYCLY